MNDINGNSALTTVLTDNALAEPEQKSDELGRDEFLRLLVTQLENQDPLSPQDNGAFVAQLAQFSSLEEAQNLSASFEDFSNSFISTQSLQATSMVGRPVHVESDFTLLAEEGPISVLADFSSSAESAILSVYNAAGSLVDTFQLGQQASGRNEFIWTGEDANNVRYPTGMYSFSVNVLEDGINTAVPIYLSSNVNSVTIEPGGSLTLNLAGIGPKSMSDVIQIN